MIAGPYSFREIKCGLFVRWDFVNCPNHSIRWLRGPESIAFRRTVFAALVEAKRMVRHPSDKCEPAAWHASPPI